MLLFASALDQPWNLVFTKIALPGRQICRFSHNLHGLLFLVTCRLREQYVESSAHYVSVADVHNDLRIYANVDLSSTEMGRVTKRAFPHISRTKRSIGWTYTGIRKKIKIETRECILCDLSRVTCKC